MTRGGHSYQRNRKHKGLRMSYQVRTIKEMDTSLNGENEARFNRHELRVIQWPDPV